MHDRKRKTGIDATAVHQNCAGTALTVIAAFFRACQMQPLAQSVEKGSARIEVNGVILAIDLQCHAN